MRLPIPTDVAGPASMGATRAPVLRTDTTGTDIAQGVGRFAQGLDQAAGALDQIASRQQEQDNNVDLSRAEAYKTAKYLDIQNSAAKDNDYTTFAERYNPAVDDALGTASNLIRDPRMRERWLADQQPTKLTMMDAIHDRGVTLHDDFNRAGLVSGLADNSKLMSDPTAPVEVRDKARADAQGSLDMAVKTGLIEPGKAVELHDQIIKGADNNLAVNLAELDILVDPQKTMVDLAIPTAGAGAGQSIVDAQMAADGKLAPMEFSLAKETAKLIGDANFPSDPKQAAAYLSDPQKALDYTEAAQAKLSDRYKGDLGAVVIAMDPNGGTLAADKWVASKHDDAMLKPAVRARLHDVMGRMVVQQPANRIPLVPAPGIDLGSYDANMLDRVEQLQSQFGKALPVVPGGQSSSSAAGAVDLDVTGLNDDQRAKLVQMASVMGFNGIGVGKNTLTLDAGTGVRAYGPDGTPKSVPGGVVGDAAAQHTSGQTSPLPTLYSGVAPEYAALTFDQRLQLYGKAKAALADRNVAGRTSLQTIADNAPAAIASTGKYDGDLPTANQFVQAYGAAEGIQRYQQFESDVDTSKTLFGMKTMTNAQIVDALHQAAPTSSGNDAALEQKKYSQISTAAKSVLDARDKDPAGYVIDAFPNVAAAYDAAQKNPKQMPAAIAAMSEAQKELGIDNPKLLPKALASAAADTFKDKTLPAQQRISGVVGLVLGVTDPAQQDQIFSQIVGEGAPAMLAGPLNAMRRGDSGAAQNLLRAALFDPDTMKTKLPAGQGDDDIKNALLEDVFGPGQIGNVVYGMTGATADNFDQVQPATDLMFNDVKQRLYDGSAGGQLDKAVELAKADLFGDDTVLSGNGGGLFNIGASVGLKVTVPKEAQPDSIRRGFNSLLPLVKQALGSAMAFPLPGADPNTNLGIQWSQQNYTDAVLSEGYFVNADGFLPNGQKGYAFYDPHTDAAVPGPNGKPLVFSLQDVQAASAGVNVGQARVQQRDRQ